MDKKKKERKSSPETEQPASNTFTNDGSFLESFKKRMEEYEKQWGNVSKPCPKPEETKSEATKAPEPAVSSNSKPVAATETEVPYYATQTMYYKESDGGQSSKKPQYQGIIGKRKTLMKTAELREKRKKRREELEEQQSAELKDQKSSAWKSYMAEVKAYEARRCGDSDDHKRPLVK